jgi:hypothetical protein
MSTPGYFNLQKRFTKETGTRLWREKRRIPPVKAVASSEVSCSGPRMGGELPNLAKEFNLLAESPATLGYGSCEGAKRDALLRCRSFSVMVAAFPRSRDHLFETPVVGDGDMGYGQLGHVPREKSSPGGKKGSSAAAVDSMVGQSGEAGFSATAAQRIRRPIGPPALCLGGEQTDKKLHASHPVVPRRQVRRFEGASPEPFSNEDDPLLDTARSGKL